MSDIKQMLMENDESILFRVSLPPKSSLCVKDAAGSVRLPKVVGWETNDRYDLRAMSKEYLNALYCLSRMLFPCSKDAII